MFVPVVPLSGPAGHAFLKRTQAQQTEALSQSASVKRLTEHFAERIGQVRSAEELVADRQLREVALGAFGLSDDIDNRFYIEKILREGTGEGSLSSRLTDKRYARMAEAFGFAQGTSPEIEDILLLKPPKGREEVLMQREGRDEDRLASILRRELREVATEPAVDRVNTGRVDEKGEPVTRAVERPATEDEKWRRIVLDVALSRAFEAVLDLPEGYDDLSTDEQVEAMRDAAKTAFGDDRASRFRDASAVEALTGQVMSALGPPIMREGFAERIVGLYEARAFEAAVGQTDPSLRLALNLERELADLAGRDVSERTKWFTVMGTPPLREVFETAFGLPASFGTLDVEQQLEAFREKAEAAFGSPDVGQFTDPEALEALNRRFLARAQIEQGFGLDTSAAGNALAILTGAV